MDPWGLFNVNLLKPGSREHQHASKIITDPKKAIIIGHGDYQGYVLGPDGKRLSSHAIEDIIKGHKDWKKGMDVELRVCGAGAGRDSRVDIVDLLKRKFPDSEVRGPYADITPEGVPFWPYIPRKGFWPTRDGGWKTIP